MCLVREYEWLREQLEEGFGKEMVEEIVYNAGRSLCYLAKNKEGRNVMVLAEHDMDTPVIIDEQYQILDVMPSACYQMSTSNYRFNDEADKIDQVRRIIEYTKKKWEVKRNG